MKQRLMIGVMTGLLTIGGIGCGKDPKPSVPTKMLEPPGSDSAGANGGSKAKKAKHTDTGEGASVKDG